MVGVNDLDDYITIEEAAALTGYTRKWITQLAQRGSIAARKVGQGLRGIWLVSRTSVLEWKRKMEEERHG